VTAPRHLTIREVSSELARALKAEARRRGTSLNQTVKDLLARALGIDSTGEFDNGLSGLAGTWSAEELAEFESNTGSFEEIDNELWR
jgi:hypothetical protein